MLTKRIIPSLDVKNGRVVKGVHFKNLQDAGDPSETAARYSAGGADELVFLDITATLEKRKTIVKVVRATAEHVFIPLCVGGGIKDLAGITALLAAGADKVSINSAAVKDAELITRAAAKFGNQCIVSAIDAKRTGKGKWEVYIDSGTKATGLDAVAWAKEAEKRGAGVKTRVRWRESRTPLLVSAARVKS